MVLVLAQEEAGLLSHDFIGTEHILLGLTRQSRGVAAQALEASGVSYEAVRDQVRERVPASPGETGGSRPFTPRAKNVLELSLREALHQGHQYIGTEHMLLGVLREPQGVAAQIVAHLADPGVIQGDVIRLLSGRGRTVGSLDSIRASCRDLQELVAAESRHASDDTKSTLATVTELLDRALEALSGSPPGSESE